MAREYPGYPSFVIVAMPKSGTKTMNGRFMKFHFKQHFFKQYLQRRIFEFLTFFKAAFSSLGYKVFDVMQINDHAKTVGRTMT